MAATRSRRRHDSELLDHAESIDRSDYSITRILPRATRKIAISAIHIRRPVGARPRKAPRWVPVDVKRVTTRSASATTSSIVSVKSGNASRIIRTISFTLSSPIQSGAPG